MRFAEIDNDRLSGKYGNIDKNVMKENDSESMFLFVQCYFNFTE